MSDLKNGITVLGSNYFEVINEITIKTTEVVNRTKVSYDLVFKKKDYDLVEINRLKFKVNKKEIENKFSLLSHLYFESIFPLQFKIVKDNLELANYKEIKKRVNKIDVTLNDKYKGEGYEYIRSSFLQQIEDERKANEFIKAIGFVNIINLALKRYNLINNFDFKWKIPAIGSTFWKLKLEKDRINEIIFKSKEVDKEQFLNALNKYRVQNKYNIIEKSEELTLENEFLATVNYEEHTLNMIESNMKCKIKLEKSFEYEEVISIKSLSVV